MRGNYDKNIYFSVNRTAASQNLISALGSGLAGNNLCVDGKSMVICKPT